MPARRGRYKQLMAVNSLGGTASKTTYANFLQERERGGWSDDGEALRYRPPPPALRSSTGEPRRRAKTVVDVTVGTQRSLDGGEKTRKTIEDHMWLHRQEERDLRRAEMDIKKNQRQVEKSMRHYEQDLEKQQKSETDWLLGQQARLLQQQQQDQHERERVTKERTGVHQLQRSTLNEHGKEFVKKGGALAFQYRQLTDMLDQKRSEVDRMSKEYEAKLRAREAEQHKIKQELAGLAISLNMEAQKRRKAEFELQREKEKSTAKDIQADLSRGEARQKEVGTFHQNASKYEDRVAGLTQDFKTKQTDAATKGRRHGRSLASVQTQLEATRTNQKLSRMAQEELEAEQKGKEVMERMERIEAQRQARQSTLHRQVRERNSAQLRTWEQNTATQLTEQQRLKHDERVKQLQKLVTHMDSQEHGLYAQVKEAEATRRKQETVVDKLQGDLDALKRDNAKRLKAAAVEAKKVEVEMEQKITREMADLTKALNLREEGMRELAIHRRRAKEDKRMLNEERKGHDRKARIVQQRDVLPVS